MKIIEHVTGEYFIGEDGSVFKQMKPWQNSGYLNVKLNGKHYAVHRLVAEAFLQKEEGKNVVNHKDGNREHNHYTNLEWVTQQENILHSHRELGESPIRNYIECELYKNGELIGNYISIKEAIRYAEQYGASPSSLEKHRKSRGFEIKERCND